jgi:uncharacterized protein
MRRLAEDTGIREGDIVFVQRSDGWGRGIVKDLADVRVRALILPAAILENGDPQILPAFREAGIPLLADTAAGVQVRGKVGLAAKDQIESALARWQDGQVQFLREKKSSQIEHMFKEYKSERGKEVKKGGGQGHGRP